MRGLLEFFIVYLYHRYLERRPMPSKNRTIAVSKAINLGTMPVFVQMIHKHFEKENPPHVASQWNSAEFEAPIDMLRLSLTDKTLADNIENITFAYKQ